MTSCILLTNLLISGCKPHEQQPDPTAVFPTAEPTLTIEPTPTEAPANFIEPYMTICTRPYDSESIRPIDCSAIDPNVLKKIENEIFFPYDYLPNTGFGIQAEDTQTNIFYNVGQIALNPDYPAAATIIILGRDDDGRINEAYIMALEINPDYLYNPDQLYAIINKEGNHAHILNKIIELNENPENPFYPIRNDGPTTHVLTDALGLLMLSDRDQELLGAHQVSSLPLISIDISQIPEIFNDPSIYPLIVEFAAKHFISNQSIHKLLELAELFGIETYTAMKGDQPVIRTEFIMINDPNFDGYGITIEFDEDENPQGMYIHRNEKPDFEKDEFIKFPDNSSASSEMGDPMVIRHDIEYFKPAQPKAA